MDVEAFCGWLRAQGAGEKLIPHFRAGAQQLLARSGPESLTPERLEELLSVDTAAGAAPRETQNMRKIGQAWLRFLQVGPPPAIPAGGNFKVIDARLAEAAPARQPIRLRPVLVGVGIVVVALWGSLRIYRRMAIGRQDAVIQTMSPYHAAVRSGTFLVVTRAVPMVDVTLVFHSYPKGDRRNVRLGFSSVTLESEKVVDWAYIASHARREEDDQEPERSPGPKPADPAQDPPLGIPLVVSVSLPMKEELQANRFDLLLTGTLDWAGLRQDTFKQSLGPFFERKK